MNEAMESLDLRVPADCRKFLNSITVNGAKVNALMFADGTSKSFASMTDEEAIRYANQYYFEVLKGEDDGGAVDMRMVSSDTN